MIWNNDTDELKVMRSSLWLLHSSFKKELAQFLLWVKQKLRMKNNVSSNLM